MACTPKHSKNLAAKYQVVMMRISLVFLTLALALSVLLVTAEISGWYRPLLIIPFFLAWQNMYQALFGT